MSDGDQKKSWDTHTFKDAVGHKSQVERWEAPGTTSANSNMELQKIGHNIKAANDPLREADYLGSIAVHYYMTPMLRQPYFVCQPGAIGKVPEAMVQMGITDLRNEMLQMFGHAAQRKRSGF